jgi:Protein of unknown function (DUF3667)
MPDPSHPACLNCGHRFQGAPLRFCPQCGQETRVRPPTVWEFVQQFGGAYVATEGALWRTLALLLARPGELTRRYLAGQRKHFVLPLRLYLTISVLVLLLMRLVAGLGAQTPLSVQVQAPPTPGTFSLDLGHGRAGMKDGQFHCTGLPDWLCQRLQRRMDVDPKGLQREMQQVGDRMLGQIGSAMFVMLPAFALWLKLVYADRRLRYTEHLVLALHLHAVWFLLLALMLPGWGPLTAAALVAVPVYGWLALRRVYGGRWWTRLLRCSALSLLYLLTLAGVSAGLALWALLF